MKGFDNNLRDREMNSEKDPFFDLLYFKEDLGHQSQYQFDTHL